MLLGFRITTAANPKNIDRHPFGAESLGQATLHLDGTERVGIDVKYGLADGANKMMVRLKPRINTQ